MNHLATAKSEKIGARNKVLGSRNQVVVILDLEYL